MNRYGLVLGFLLSASCAAAFLSNYFKPALRKRVVSRDGQDWVVETFSRHPGSLVGGYMALGWALAYAMRLEWLVSGAAFEVGLLGLAIPILFLGLLILLNSRRQR